MRFLTRVGGALLIVATIGVLFADVHWFVELFAHYRPHLALAAVLLALLSLMSRRYVFGCVLLMVGLMHASVLIVHWAPRSAVAVNSPPPLRAISLNLGKQNKRLDLVTSLIERERPALVALIEIDETELQVLQPVMAAYHKAEFVGDSGFGVALYSLDPMISADLVKLAGEPYPALVANINRAGREITAVVAHPPPPVNARWAKAHGRQIDALHALIRDGADKPVIVLADLNTSPWAPAFRRLISGLGLINASTGFAYAPTWPAALGVFGIPIDYCLVSRSVSVIRYRTGPDVGSDHRPIIVDLLL